MVKIKTTKHGQNIKIKNTATIFGIVMLIVVGMIIPVSAFQDPYGLTGHIYDKDDTAIVGANITFKNTNTGEVIYFDSVTNGEYSQDALNFPSGYTNGDTIEYTVTYNNNVSWNQTTAVIDTSGGGTSLDIILDQAPTAPTSPTNLGMNLVDHTPTITWTKGTDADSGDTVTTYVYVGTEASPTTEEGHNTGTTIDLGSTVTLVDGTTYYYRLRSYDGERWSDYTADDQFRMNSKPTVSSVQISPATAYTDTGLTGSGTYDDAEGDTESGTTYKWFKNGAEISGETTTSLASSNFKRGDEIIFQYTPHDGYEAGTPVNSSVKTISNSLPTVPTTLDLTATIYVGDTLTATGSGSTDADTSDGDTLTYYYEFKDGATELQAYSTDNTYVIPQGEAHDTITVNCKVYDGVTYSSVKSENKVVSDTKPTTPTGSSIEGTTKYVGDTLTVTGAGSTDADGDSVTYQYEFRRGSVSGTVVQALSDTNTYTIQTADAHDTIYVLVYGRAYSVNSDNYEAENRVVTNSVPVLASIGAKNVDDKVQVTVDADASDGDGDTRTYSCNRTDLFSDFSTSTGLGHWTPFYNQSGVYHVDFGVSDGYGGTDNETITITVNDVTFNTSLSSGYQILAYIGETNGTAETFGDSIPAWDYVVNRSASGVFYSHANNSGVNNFVTEKGRGYYVSTTATTPFARSRIDDVEYTTSLTSGWEMIGWTNITSVTAEEMETDIGAECTFSTAKNMTSGLYETHQHGFDLHNFDVDIGVGYFVYVSGNVDWIRQQ